ncbi:hypothetical protein CLIB1423_08S04874 [[Candida] railenensis]|uniref:Uncharacterized protein n=1 Tax=[Candida] railenensis TaxID=45579 RepID=A0A9P0QRA8_9ASCO|nr:hypothetical protein CLIB1423_08S04874 [[Candida] railenensis]
MISTPVAPVNKMTAQEKEAQIMQEIRASQVKFEPKFETTFLGQIFGISFKTTA